MNDEWTVMSRGPARTDAWRTVFRGAETLAREHYRQQLAALKAGHLLPIHGDGKPVCSRWIPQRWAGPPVTA
jgi:hypothetical protein